MLTYVLIMMHYLQFTYIAMPIVLCLEPALRIQIICRKEFETVTKSLGDIGFKNEEISEIYRILAVIILIGNIVSDYNINTTWQLIMAVQFNNNFCFLTSWN